MYAHLQRPVVGLLAVVVSVVLCGTECERERIESLDNGLLERNGYSLEPAELPWLVLIDESVDDEEFGFDRSLINEAVQWWNEQGLGELFVLSTDGVPETNGTIWVMAGFTSSEVEILDDGTTGVPGTYDFAYTDTGEILYGIITVSSDFTYHSQTVLDTLKHELGHTLGLDDDPGPPQTVDLHSVMGSPLVENGDLTEHDYSLLLPIAQ